MKMLDLFCGAGGCSVGYYRAGFHDITGVDIKPMPRYPYRFIQADALEYLAAHGHEYDVIHASPPCQAYSVTAGMSNVDGDSYPKLVGPVREFLQATGKPYAIENVPGAPLQNYVTLCGTMFGLKLFRHRLFETSFFMLGIPHAKHDEQIGKNGFVCMAGHGDSGRGRIPADHRDVLSWKRAAGIDWMTRDEMAQAIPPAYTQWIGERLLESMAVRA
jgi:DNA (cytosine-5)-methyltransferase 1